MHQKPSRLRKNSLNNTMASIRSAMLFWMKYSIIYTEANNAKALYLLILQVSPFLFPALAYWAWLPIPHRCVPAKLAYAKYWVQV